MHNNYFRLNPGLAQDIKLDRASEADRKLMTEEVNRYLATEEGKQKLEQVINCILTPDDYYKKALVNLQKAAEILEYCKIISQEPNDEISK
jgi:hypothetical protein